MVRWSENEMRKACEMETGTAKRSWVKGDANDQHD